MCYLVPEVQYRGAGKLMLRPWRNKPFGGAGLGHVDLVSRQSTPHVAYSN
jgi:hypothetical protein